MNFNEDQIKPKSNASKKRVTKFVKPDLNFNYDEEDSDENDDNTNNN